jgi:hypothetical protein
VVRRRRGRRRKDSERVGAGGIGWEEEWVGGEEDKIDSEKFKMKYTVKLSMLELMRLIYLKQAGCHN